MSKKLTYNGLLGPEVVSFGDAGQFVKGQPQLVEDDEIANQLLAKGCFDEEIESPAAALLAPPAGKKAADKPLEV